MTFHSKHIFAVLLCFALFSLTACSPAEKPVFELDAELIWTESDQWPNNEFTRNIPQPVTGPLVRYSQGTSSNYGFFSLELSDIPLEDCKTYLQAIEDAGFSPISELEEEPSPGFVSIANVYLKEETGLSLAYSSGAEGLMLYISRPISNA